MTTAIGKRTCTCVGLVLIAFGAFAAARAAPDEESTVRRARARVSKRSPAPPPLPVSFPASHGFYESQLAPRMSADPGAKELFPIAPLGVPASKLWATDPAVVAHVEQRTIHSVRDAFKGYLVERLGIDHWSVPVLEKRRSDDASRPDGFRAVRIRLGFSRLAPRADVLIPVATGRVALSVDARGDMRATFDPTSSRFRVTADVDVPGHTATVGLGVKF